MQIVDDVLEVSTKPVLYDGDTGGPKEIFAFTVRKLERLGVELRVSNSLTLIGAYAFQDCSSLRTLTIPNSQKVLESGLLALQAQLATSPKRATAVARQGSAVLRASFFERLLEGHVELKACPANDVAAAQGDLKKLSLSQLLALRILTKDFPTTSVGSLKVHGHFLAALSSELFQQLGARALGDEIATRRRLEQIGQRLVLCLGAAELLSSVAGPTLPQRWLSSIEEEDGSGSGLVLVDVCEHTAEVLEGTAGDFDPHRGVSIAVIDLGSGSTSSVNWEVVTMDAAKAGRHGQLG
eukprot:g31033.t1